ncbi:tRNA glutamyl-Q(34) synthetase GluQRS [Geminicoccaceae bacterium 1502E]|nr:tRNA glutamyl-Q(34) synthetase GluQRS [Geminicoccaceae bacterium 1502E]
MGQGHVTRFAPSPTGLLHLGHAYAALFACESAHLSGGRFLLRFEDIDSQRCRPEFEQATLEDLRWLGLQWDGEPVRQSERLAIYGEALEALRAQGVLYPCFCSRKQIRMEVEEAGRAPHGPAGELVYPGVCRGLAADERRYRMDRGEPYAWRLDIGKALGITGKLWWRDWRAGWIEADPLAHGDVVLARKDAASSYHLAVTVDDALQGVTLVTRGEDLFHATHVHRVLQALLGLPTPDYYHHNLIADSTGERMSKRNRAVTLRHLRGRHRTPDDIWRLIGLEATAAAAG